MTVVGLTVQVNTYKLEVALDPLLYHSIVDLYYDLGDNVSINVSTGNCWVQANEADALIDQPNCSIYVYYTVGPNWKNYYIRTRRRSLSQ